MPFGSIHKRLPFFRTWNTNPPSVHQSLAENVERHMPAKPKGLLVDETKSRQACADCEFCLTQVHSDFHEEGVMKIPRIGRTTESGKSGDLAGFATLLLVV